MPRSLLRILLLAALALATWGLWVTVPRLLDAHADYVARALYVVIVWAFIWVATAIVLVRSFR